MKKLLVLLVASISVVVSSFSAAETFSTDRPTPLKLAKPRHDRVVHFTGTVELSGRFIVKWDYVNDKPHYLRVIFFPDGNSMALLPHATGEGPVKELLFPNADQAAAILLDSETAQRILAKELLGAAGEATVTVGDYRTVIDCDHRWYMAELISASKSLQIAAGIQQNPRFGC